MPNSTVLTFCYKGTRTYIHGTDIFSELIKKYVNNIGKIDIAFHGISTNNLRFYKKKPLNETIKVTFKYQQNGNLLKLFGVETNDKVTCRYAYKEEDIIRNSIINIQSSTISLKKHTNYQFIEHIVAMNKALLETIYSDVKGKWYFTRLQLLHTIEMQDINTLDLKFLSNFQFKLTKTVIIVNGLEVGHIYFSLIPKES